MLLSIMLAVQKRLAGEVCDWEGRHREENQRVGVDGGGSGIFDP